MGNFLIGMVFLSYLFSLFSFSTSYMGAWRAFYGLFSTRIEASIIQFDELGNPVAPYFDLIKLSEEIGFQLEESLSNICRYEYRVVGADPDSKKEDPRQRSAVIVSLSCFHWSEEPILSKKAFFSIVEALDGK